MNFSCLKRAIFDRPLFWLSNQETPYLVASVLGKLNPGKSFDWHVLGFEVQEINVHKVTNAGKKKGKLASKN